jgi:hypothetical protein
MQTRTRQQRCIFPKALFFACKSDVKVAKQGLIYQNTLNILRVTFNEKGNEKGAGGIFREKGAGGIFI